ncbi:MAG: hypothetical protein QW291_09055 [Thermofilaceae archaeon]
MAISTPSRGVPLVAVRVELRIRFLRGGREIVSSALVNSGFNSLKRHRSSPGSNFLHSEKRLRKSAVSLSRVSGIPAIPGPDFSRLFQLWKTPLRA